ncbi:MAG TPA: aldehyde dehydrogenase family protein, partial [Polyangia bacterium]|nr:aldehyde dehydrogenase family protein [Polyangia bacterium]
MAIQSINPATGARGPSFEPLTESELEDKLARSRSAFATWSRLPVAARAGVVAHAGEIFAREAAELGRLATEEMGKLVDAGKQEVEKCAGSCRYYAENA